MPNPSQDPLVTSEATNEDLKDMDNLCTFKIMIESKNSEHSSTKDQWPYQINMRIPNPNQEPPVSSKAPNLDLKDMDAFSTF